jgi:transglutaminase-like putative cysteine protease
MRIRIGHVTTYHYQTPPKSVTQTLRLTPRNYDALYVADWRIETSADCTLHPQEDAFGNLTHTFTAEGPFDAFTVTIEGVVETTDTAGLVTGAIERFPPSLFLRETPLTAPDDAIVAFAQAAQTAAGENGTLALMHRLLSDIHSTMAFDPGTTQTSTTAAEAFALRRGVCQDLTHVLIACARHLGIPARYVGGYFHRIDGITAQDAGHAWAELYVDRLGWVAFDPANGICATDAHVRVAVGLDYYGAAPVRGTRYGGDHETLDVSVTVDQARHQAQT